VLQVETTKNKKTYSKILHYTTGLAILPEPGGLLDQPYRLMEFFDLFQDGDRMAFTIQLKQ